MIRDKSDEVFPVTWGDLVLVAVSVLVLLRGLSAATAAEHSGFDEGLEAFALIAVTGAALGGGGIFYQLRHPLPPAGRARSRLRNIRLILLLAPFLAVLGAALERWGSVGFQLAFYGFGSGFMLSVMLVYVGYNAFSRRP